MKNLLILFTVAVVVFIAEAFIVKLLWNWLFPEMFNAPFLDFWQALSILLLCNILFKNHSIKKSED